MMVMSGNIEHIASNDGPFMHTNSFSGLVDKLRDKNSLTSLTNPGVLR